jgi:hypothetical protein
VRLQAEAIYITNRGSDSKLRMFERERGDGGAHPLVVRLVRITIIRQSLRRS